MEMIPLIDRLFSDSIKAISKARDSRDGALPGRRDSARRRRRNCRRAECRSITEERRACLEGTERITGGCRAYDITSESG